VLTVPGKSLECAPTETADTATRQGRSQEAKASKLFNNQASKRVGPVRDDVFTDNQFWTSQQSFC